MKRDIIILNGPPGVGKDTLAKFGGLRFNASHLSFKAPMFEIAHAMLGDRGFNAMMDAYNDRSRKELPMRVLGGISPREFMIHISEAVVKPLLGKDRFGVLLCERIEKAKGRVIISDGGFPDEIESLVLRLPFDTRVNLFRLHRKGFQFEGSGDSRNYIYLPHLVSDRYREFDITLFDGCVMEALNDIAEEMQK